MYSYYKAFVSSTSKAVHLVRYVESGHSLCMTQVRHVAWDAVCVPLANDDALCKRCAAVVNQAHHQRLVSFGRPKYTTTLTVKPTIKRRKKR